MGSLGGLPKLFLGAIKGFNVSIGDVTVTGIITGKIRFDSLTVSAGRLTVRQIWFTHGYRRCKQLSWMNIAISTMLTYI